MRAGLLTLPMRAVILAALLVAAFTACITGLVHARVLLDYSLPLPRGAVSTVGGRSCIGRVYRVTYPPGLGPWNTLLVAVNTSDKRAMPVLVMPASGAEQRLWGPTWPGSGGPRKLGVYLWDWGSTWLAVLPCRGTGLPWSDFSNTRIVAESKPIDGYIFYLLDPRSADNVYGFQPLYAPAVEREAFILDYISPDGYATLQIINTNPAELSRGAHEVRLYVVRGEEANEEGIDLNLVFIGDMVTETVYRSLYGVAGVKEDVPGLLPLWPSLEDVFSFRSGWLGGDNLIYTICCSPLLRNITITASTQGVNITHRMYNGSYASVTYLSLSSRPIQGSRSIDVSASASTPLLYSSGTLYVYGYSPGHGSCLGNDVVIVPGPLTVKPPGIAIPVLLSMRSTESLSVNDSLVVDIRVDRDKPVAAFLNGFRLCRGIGGCYSRLGPPYAYTMLLESIIYRSPVWLVVLSNNTVSLRRIVVAHLSAACGRVEGDLVVGIEPFDADLRPRGVVMLWYDDGELHYVASIGSSSVEVKEGEGLVEAMPWLYRGEDTRPLDVLEKVLFLDPSSFPLFRSIIGAYFPHAIRGRGYARVSSGVWPVYSAILSAHSGSVIVSWEGGSTTFGLSELLNYLETG